MKEIGNIQDYIVAVLGIGMANNGKLALSAPFGHMFDAHQCSIASVDYILLSPKVEDQPMPQLISRLNAVAAKVGKCCVLVVNALNGSQRRQLLKSNTSFIIPGRQLYLPTLGAYFTEKKLNELRAMPTVSPSTQMLLLYQLEKGGLDGCSFGAIAEKVGYPVKTVSLAAEELRQADICGITQIGRSKKVSFNYQSRELWERTLPMMSSPIMKVGYAMPGDIDLLAAVRSHDEALSHYTDMGERDKQCVAIDMRSPLGKAVYNALSGTDFADAIRVEFWKYDPAKLQVDGYIDPLSMALCYRNDADERVQGQINRLIDKTL